MSESVLFETSLGSFTVTLDRERAPRSVENFLAYVDAGHYAGTVFHRMIAGYMIQGGGYALADGEYTKKPVGEPIPCEADNGRKNLRGTVAMARTSDPHSATAQFFVNVADVPIFDHKAPTPDSWGYAVFGEVTDGMDVVDAIVASETGAVGPFRKDCPLEPVIIRSARRA